MNQISKDLNDLWKSFFRFVINFRIIKTTNLLTKIQCVMKLLKSVLIMAMAIVNFNLMAQEATVPDLLRNELKTADNHVYVIERELPGAGNLSAEELEAISQTSCGVLQKMGEENIKWLHSYVTGDKIYCVYRAKNEDLVREHASKGGFPANSVAEVKTVIDPSTANLD